MSHLALALAVAAAGVGSLHAVAPDHWVPISALSCARDWSLARTARVATLCGFGHVTVSAGLGIAALISGTAVVEAFGARTGAIAGIVLIVFGVVYALWNLRRRARPHAHEASTIWTLFAIYCADPCVAVVPIIFAAAPLSRGATVIIVVVYELATIAAMSCLALIARVGARRLRGRWIERHGDSAAGGLIAVTGLVVAIAGW